VSDPYLINNTDLSTFASKIETAEGLQVTPEFRDEDIEIPSAHGVLDLQADPSSPRRRYGAGRIRFNMWVKGVDPDTGVKPSGTALDAYFARVDEMVRLFHARTLQIDHTRPDGTRRAIGRLVGELDFTREPSSPWFGRYVADVVIPGAFWADTTPITVGTPAGGVATGTSFSLADFAPANAPIADGVVAFGPGSNPTFIQGGTFLAYDGIIAAGRELTVDCSDWSLGAGAGDPWLPDRAAIRYNPGPSWFELDPTAEPLEASLTHTGGGLMTVSLTATRKYLTS
jgi:hypothetical protein